MKIIGVYRISKALIFNSINLVFLYFGVILGLTGPMNILIFSSWVIFIGSISLLFTNDEGVRTDLPMIINRIFFSTMIGVLAWYGYFLTAFLWLASFLIAEHLIQKYKGKQTKNIKVPQALKPSAQAQAGTNINSAEEAPF